MDIKTLSLLQCPYCHSSLRVQELFKRFPRLNTIQFGAVQCQCDIFPIVEGILYLKKSATAQRQAAIDLSRQGKYQAAILALFEERRRSKIPYWLLVQGLVRPQTLRGFLRLLSFFTPAIRAWLAHLAERDRRPTFFLALATLAYLPPSRKASVLVDVGCSAGWFLPHLFRRASQATVIGIETSFSALYLARKYMVKARGNLICTDVDLGLPFRPQVINQVFVNDTFMYLKRQALFLQEAHRITRHQSLIFLTHVHDALAENDGRKEGITRRALTRYARQYSLFGTTDEDFFRTLVSNTPHSYRRLSASRKLLPSRSYSFVLAQGQFKTQSSPTWVDRLLKKTKLHFIEDPQLKS